MADWPSSPVWIDPATVNKGKQYDVADGFTVSDLNKMFINLLYLKNHTITTDIMEEISNLESQIADCIKKHGAGYLSSLDVSGDIDARVISSYIGRTSKFYICNDNLGALGFYGLLVYLSNYTSNIKNVFAIGYDTSTSTPKAGYAKFDVNSNVLTFDDTAQLTTHASITDKGIPVWDASKQMFVDSGKKADDIGSSTSASVSSGTPHLLYEFVEQTWNPGYDWMESLVHDTSYWVCKGFDSEWRSADMIENNIEIVIADYIDGYPVKVIGAGAFENSGAYITSIVVPPTVETIENYAFQNVSHSGVRVYLSEGLKHIGTGALDCPMLRCRIPSTVHTIQPYAFGTYFATPDQNADYARYISFAETANWHRVDPKCKNNPPLLDVGVSWKDLLPLLELYADSMWYNALWTEGDVL